MRTTKLFPFLPKANPGSETLQRRVPGFHLTNSPGTKVFWKVLKRAQGPIMNFQEALEKRSRGTAENAVRTLAAGEHISASSVLKGL